MKPFLTIAASTLALAVLSGCTASGTVMGTVLEDRGNRPVSDATITLTPVKGPYGYEPQSTPLNYGGNFNIKVKEGEYKVSIEHQSMVLCEPPPALVKVTGNEITETKLCMTQRK